MTRIFIATGGTGGHIIPARCLAQNLSRKNHQIFVFGDKKYVNYINEDDGFKSFIIISSQAFDGIFGHLKMTVKIGFGFLQSIYYFLRFRPDFVYGFGGYATFPILIAAIIFRKKIILHEQNSHLGKVNRLFAKFSYKIALTFAKTDAILPEFVVKTVFTGNPVRQEILALNQLKYTLPQEKEMKKRDKMGYDDLILAAEFDDYQEYLQNKEMLNILIIGGSGGTQIFSEILPKVFFNLSETIKNEIEITQQCRQDLVESTFRDYDNFNISVTVNHFFEDMATEIKKAHIVIARAGSSSLAEFCVAKKPMILIPFAKSADNHQQKNARFFEEIGAAIIIEEKDFTINKMSQIITNLLTQNRNILFEMSNNCKKIAILDADEKLANLIA
ncbi:MAG TPA: UDP-N-acetylglucosamine--N-acetylmuramyl-(pentapeptide) pyrophosphoryl-undecaprenol N-acetylglucosamine transferase [Rickettsiales bacterium]|nr:UDP-N-acetylglucosamine--N-acetylmuramyl-(pentapeptide) pyrophosphoryl-undecaprenol N-acetylglucosamine transferase [Rickettsiales bacterium]